MKHPYFGHITFPKAVALLILAFMLLPLILFVISLDGGQTGGALCAAAGTITMLDLAKMNSSESVVPLVEEHVGSFPELTSISAEQLGAGELSYETLHRISYPSVEFHDMGGGLTSSKSVVAKRKFEVFPLGGRIEAAKHVADNFKRGGAAGYFAFEAAGIMKASIFKLARQIWYGKGGADGKGFPGLKNFTAFGDTTADPMTGKTYPMTINAGGTTANSASSAYLVVTGPDDVQLKFGLGSVFELPDPRIGDINDPIDPTKKVEAYISVLQGFAGLQTANFHSVRRILNLTDEVGKGMSDYLLALAMKSFPAGVKPTAIYMSPNQLFRLQTSRTVVLQASGTTRTDQPNVAPLPTDYAGIPIYVTDAISDTDAIEVAAAPEE